MGNGETSLRLRWRSKGGAGSLHYGNNSSFRFSFNSNDAFEGDILLCNSRLRKKGNPNDPSKIWEVGKLLWSSCCRNEEEIIEEFRRMKDRDKGIRKKLEEGIQDELL